MKKTTFSAFIALLLFNSVNAQVLYTENFDNYPVGNFGTDITGTIPGQGGWYTEIINHNPSVPLTASEIKITPETSKGNVLVIADKAKVYGKYQYSAYCLFYRSDINTYWQQRTLNNDVLKISFDMYTDDNPYLTDLFYLVLYNKKEILLQFEYRNEKSNPLGSMGLPPRGRTFVSPLGTPNVILPTTTWVTVEIYLAYNLHRAYLSIPSLNYTAVKSTVFPLSLKGGTGNNNFDDNPVKLEFFNSYGGSIKQIPQGRKIDNITISAQNTVPPVTVGLNEFLSDQFNLYPNPATNVVNITNSDNMFVNQVQVYDLLGKLINTQNFTNETEIQLNVETLTSGTYLLHLQTEEGTAVKKLIKK